MHGSDKKTAKLNLKEDPDLGLPLGVTYEGRGSAAVVLQTIVTASEAAGMTSDVEKRHDAVWEARFVQSCSWLRTLCLGLPQKAIWRILCDDASLRVTGDFFPYRWCQVAFYIVCIGLVPIFYLFVHRLDELDPVDGRGCLVVGLIMLLLSLLGLSVRLLGFFGGNLAIYKIWYTVVAQIEEEGGHLAPARRGNSRRFAGHALAYLAWIISWPLVFILSTMFESFLWYREGILLLLLLTLLTLSATLLLIYFEPAAGTRMQALIYGLYLPFLLLFLASIPWMTIVMAGDIQATVLVFSEPPASASNMGRARYLALLYQAVQVAIGLTGAVLAWFILRMGLYAWFPLEQISKWRDSGLYLSATRGGRPLTLLRVALLIVWGIFSALTWATLIFAAVVAIEMLLPWEGLGIRPQVLWADLLTVAVGAVPPWTVVRVLASSCWLVYTVVLWALLFASMNHLLLTRSRWLGRLEAHTVHSEPLQELLSLDRIPANLRVRLARFPGKGLIADSHEFGLFRPKRFIRITEDTEESLSEEGFRALLAHELSHFISGDLRRDRWLRYLGRLTFVGDGFVRALQDSYTAERRADLLAGERFGVTQEALQNALQQRKSARQAQKLARFMARIQEAGIGLDSESVTQDPDRFRKMFQQKLSRLPFHRTWRLALRLYLDQYLSRNGMGMRYQYWHPRAADRGS